MIRKKIIKALKYDKTAKAKLQLALDKSAPTIERYLTTNDVMLTTAKSIAVIKEATGLKEDQILEPQHI